MISRGLLLPVAAALSLVACSGAGGSGFGNGYYSLVRPARVVKVGNGSLTVVPPREWNRANRGIFTDVRWVEDWTLNGPYLDGVSFVSGLPDDEKLIQQERKADRKIPKFRASMTAPEVAAMVETLYRVGAGSVDFRTLALTPRPFLGQPGFQFDFEHLDGDELWRRGRAVGTVVNGRLYMVMLDAARSHYYGAALPDFEAMVVSAQRRT
ncbi:hypothetical protein ACFQPG_10085 [Sphingomonas sp. GCM10030256]|uniref:hypothetical protein n=1 Tax=Sphingomonas sp. GCM10030256 TaxID=3273427 RepID=UPI00360BDA08